MTKNAKLSTNNEKGKYLHNKVWSYTSTDSSYKDLDSTTRGGDDEDEIDQSGGSDAIVFKT